MGCRDFVVSAEPAVRVKCGYVRGAVSASTMKGLVYRRVRGAGFSMLRIVLGFNVMAFASGAAALVLMIYAQVVHGIAFDSGASPAGHGFSFVLPMAIERPCLRRRRYDMFGRGAVALAPLISIQILTIIGVRRRHKIFSKRRCRIRGGLT
ncbi:MAG: DUF1538 family protein [Christensenellaceae bacterium]